MDAQMLIGIFTHIHIHIGPSLTHLEQTKNLDICVQKF